jgi:hypothetical protein
MERMEGETDVIGNSRRTRGAPAVFGRFKDFERAANDQGRGDRHSLHVMAGLVLAIHVCDSRFKAWMPSNSGLPELDAMEQHKSGKPDL